ncbi:hypothetical protein NC652_001838 [Populus alba x Populus x berolinensis]|nr:hypothetical protein NC652_001838 [Populus alba x Populus x berolinensis]
MFLNLHLSAQPPSHLHLSSLNLSHNPPSQPPSSSLISQPFSQSSLNIFISHLSQTFFKALSTTPPPKVDPVNEPSLCLISQSFCSFL